MAKAYRLEDAGHLGAAADAYLRVLTCPDQVRGRPRVNVEPIP